jgi:hypothetical protein
MTKFMLLYRGNPTPPEKMTPEQRDHVMGQWGAWMEKHGTAITDIGTPFGERSSVGGDGAEQAPPALTGYTVVEAGNLEEAKGFSDGHPFLDGAGADFAVDVFELVPIPM